MPYDSKIGPSRRNHQGHLVMLPSTSFESQFFNSLAEMRGNNDNHHGEEVDLHSTHLIHEINPSPMDETINNLKPLLGSSLRNPFIDSTLFHLQKEIIHYVFPC